MKKQDFDALLQSVGQASRHARGETVPGLEVHSRTIDRNAVAVVRIKVGLTQAEFARVLGASLGTIRKWETGTRQPSGAAATLLRVLDSNPDVVFSAMGMTPAMPRRTPRSQLVAAR